MIRGDKGELFILFVPLFTLSLLSRIVCSLFYHRFRLTYGLVEGSLNPNPHVKSYKTDRENECYFKRKQYSFKCLDKLQGTLTAT